MKSWLALFLLPTLAPFASHAQGGQPPPRMVLQALDTDGDGQLSAQEIEAASASLAKLDRNHDGQITGDEYSPKMQDQTAATDLLTRLMAMDRNGDGVLTPDELPERMRAMFDRGDTNHDGKLTPDEIKAMASTQADPQGRPVGRGNASGMLRMDPVMDAIDVDHDGVLSCAEIASASGALKTLDKDADGVLSVGELRMRQQTAQQRAEHLFDEWDTNKDGGLTKSELPDRMQSQFDAIDLNHDGKINMEEATTYFATMPAQGGNRPGGPRDGNGPAVRERMPQNDAPSSTTPPPASPKQ
ncbi:MAG: EF-hand domain-containing protein [Janthinobacterium lividum]